MTMIYLDHNATTPLHPAVLTAMTAQLKGGVGNASSVHRAGRKARQAVEKARRQLAQSLSVFPGEVVFTSGATEALHLAICGCVRAGGHVVTSAVEHPAVYGALAVAGAEVTQVAPSDDGFLDPKTVLAAVRTDTVLIVVMAAQNETGVCHSVAQIAQNTAVPVLCDGVQAFGKLPFNPKESGCAMAVVSGHKIGGPMGCGALWVRPGLVLEPHTRGGPQERGRRGGTENVPAIVGLGVAASLVAERRERMAAVAHLRDEFEARLAAAIDGVHFHGRSQARTPNTSAFRIDGVAGDVLLTALDLEGICISSGSACSAGALEPSATLLAMGLTETQARGGLRVSLGPETTTQDLDIFLEKLPELVARARSIPCE